jgi:hypothetical protein
MFSTGKQICLYTYLNPDLLHLAAKNSQGEENNIESNDYINIDTSDLFTSD